MGVKEGTVLPFAGVSSVTVGTDGGTHPKTATRAIAKNSAKYRMLAFKVYTSSVFV